MKWGVRRFQPYPKGKSHKGKFLGKVKKGVSNTSDSVKKSAKRVTGKVSKAYNNRVSKHEKRYIDQGVSSSKAKKLAKKRVRAEIALAAAAAGVTVYAASKGTKAIGRNFIDKEIDTPLQTLNAQGDRDLSKPFYATFENRDNKKYEGLFGGFHLGGSKHGAAIKEPTNVFKQVIERDEPIKIAAHNNGRKALEKAMGSNDSMDFKMALNSAGISPTATKVTRKQYEAFNRSLPEAHMLDFETGSSRVKPFYEELKKQGYSGLLDINDQKYSGFNAKNPAIIFEKGMDAVESSSQIPVDQVHKAANREMGVLATRQLSQVTAGGVVALNSKRVIDVEQEARESR